MATMIKDDLWKAQMSRKLRRITKFVSELGNEELHYLLLYAAAVADDREYAMEQAHQKGKEIK